MVSIGRAVDGHPPCDIEREPSSSPLAILFRYRDKWKEMVWQRPEREKEN